MAAKCGKILLEQKDELERQIDAINREYQQRIEVTHRYVLVSQTLSLSVLLKNLEQERHELRLLVEQIQSECETKMLESNEDKNDVRRQLDDLRREQRLHDGQQTQLLQELTEANFKLSKDLQLVRRTIELRYFDGS